MAKRYFPKPLMGFYEPPMWQSIADHAMSLQCCDACGAWQYPPAPACVECLSEQLTWKPLSGEGEILSWIVFHRQYLETYPAPYNVVSVRLKEGPILTSNLVGAKPEGSWIGAHVRMVYTDFPDGSVLPRFELADAPAAERPERRHA